jgi:hypothetical protein
MMGKDDDDGGARRSDPRTSWDAAASISVTVLERRVFQALCDCPRGAILDELIDMTGLQKVTVSPRLKPLESKGKIKRIGKRPGKAKRQQTVWSVVMLSSPAPTSSYNDIWTNYARKNGKGSSP